MSNSIRYGKRVMRGGSAYYSSIEDPVVDYSEAVFGNSSISNRYFGCRISFYIK